MTESLEVTAIIPVYNGAEHIAAAFRSVVSQTFQPKEVVIVDDGSTDESAAAIRAIAAVSHIPVIVLTQANAGQSAARNAAAAVATGELLAFIDQDDLWRPRHLEALVAHFDEQPDLGWTYSDFDEIDVEGNVVTRNFLVNGGYSMYRSGVAQLIADDIMVLPTASVIRASAFNGVGGFDPQFIGYEDDDLFIRVFRSGWRSVFVPEAVTAYRIHANSSSTRQSYGESRMKFYRKLAAALPDDHRLGRYYMTDVLRPRIMRSALHDYAVALSQSNFTEAAVIAKDLRELVFDGNPTPRKRLGVAVLARPRLSRVVLKAFRWIPRWMRPTLPGALDSWRESSEKAPIWG